MSKSKRQEARDEAQRLIKESGAGGVPKFKLLEVLAKLLGRKPEGSELGQIVFGAKNVGDVYYTRGNAPKTSSDKTSSNDSSIGVPLEGDLEITVMEGKTQRLKARVKKVIVFFGVLTFLYVRFVVLA